MFIKIRNLESAFRLVRGFCFTLTTGAILLAGLIAWLSFRSREQYRDRVYVLSSGKVLEAFASSRKDNIPVEARDHIRSFHEYFFTLSPDEKVINANIGRALYLADASAKRLFDNLKENGYYSGIISGNINQEINVDSIALDTHSYPFYFRCFATQKIIRATSIVTRDLITEGWLRNTDRSDNDPHGFLIERWNTIENKDLNIQNRLAAQ